MRGSRALRGARAFAAIVAIPGRGFIADGCVTGFLAKSLKNP
jgi:hypothetical protein